METNPVPYGCWGVLALLAMGFACLAFPPLIIVFLILIGLWTRWHKWRERQALAKLRAQRDMANASTGADTVNRKPS